MSVKAVLLGAGKGTRMKSDLAKVLHEAAGRPLINWMLEIVSQAGVVEVVVVVGHQAEEVASVLPPGTKTALQAEQLGTGHAARVGFEALAPSGDDIVLVLPGDMPLIRHETLEHLVELHRGTGAAATLLSCEPADPTGYGRILRGADGHVLGIVEQRDATDAQLAIREVGTSVYAFTADVLAEALDSLTNHNSQGEYYLTDVIGALAGAGRRVEALVAAAVEGEGVNSHDQLASAAAELRRRINKRWMREGVWMQDPDRTYIDADVVLEPGARLYADTHLEGATSVAAGAEVGPATYARDSRIGPAARVWYSVLRQADVGARAEVGP
jgi:bifunctional UDP-N-acetylglucosamine pyrophosphorylase/glucosamine-1-phosphate N-acetyltransferase